MITTATSIAYSRQGSQTGLVRINNQSKEDVGFNDCHVMINDDRGIIQMIIIVIIEILKFNFKGRKEDRIKKNLEKREKLILVRIKK